MLLLFTFVGVWTSHGNTIFASMRVRIINNIIMLGTCNKNILLTIWPRGFLSYTNKLLLGFMDTSSKFQYETSTRDGRTTAVDIFGSRIRYIILSTDGVMPDNMPAHSHNHVINDSLKSSSNVRMQITQTRKCIFGINSHTKNVRMCDCISNYYYRPQIQ